MASLSQNDRNIIAEYSLDKISGSFTGATSKNRADLQRCVMMGRDRRELLPMAPPTKSDKVSTMVKPASLTHLPSEVSGENDKDPVFVAQAEPPLPSKPSLENHDNKSLATLTRPLFLDSVSKGQNSAIFTLPHPTISVNKDHVSAIFSLPPLINSVNEDQNSAILTLSTLTNLVNKDQGSAKIMSHSGEHRQNIFVCVAPEVSLSEHIRLQSLKSRHDDSTSSFSSSEIPTQEVSTGRPCLGPLNPSQLSLNSVHNGKTVVTHDAIAWKIAAIEAEKARKAPCINSTADTLIESLPKACGKQFSPGKRFKCSCCPRSFTRAFDRSRHHETVHQRQRRFLSCPGRKCHRTGQAGFTRHDHLRVHLRRVHPGLESGPITSSRSKQARHILYGSSGSTD